jgi:hypothetical protein
MHEGQVAALEEPRQRVDDVRTELRAGARLDLAHGLVYRPAAAVRAVVCHRVEAVRDRRDQCAFGDLLADKAIRVAGAIPALVVVPRDARR